jgi:hypothetical protein
MCNPVCYLCPDKWQAANMGLNSGCICVFIRIADYLLNYSSAAAGI